MVYRYHHLISSIIMHVLYLVALLGGGILLIGLISHKNKQTALLPKDDAKIMEGFKVKKIKFPSVKDITKPILSPIKAIDNKIKGIVKKIIGGFKLIFDWIKKGLAFLIFFPQCFLWYFLHILGYILYTPIGFFVWVFSLQSVEKFVFKIIEYIDKQVHRISGVHIFQFSDIIQARCYFSKSKLREIREKNKNKDQSSFTSLNDPAIDDSDSIGYLVFVVFLLVGVGFVMSMISN